MANQETKKTLTVVDRSTKALTAAADGIVKAAADLQGIASLATGLAQDIEFKQNELDNLDEQLVAKQREQAAELRLRVREDEDKVLAELLKARGLVTKTPAEIKEVEKQLAEALEDINTLLRVNKKVSLDVLDEAAKYFAAELKKRIKMSTKVHPNSWYCTEITKIRRLPYLLFIFFANKTLATYQHP